MKEIKIFQKEEFRKWLHKNHSKENKVALILHKKHTGKDSPSHKELMEEAICYGWIDTTIRRLDGDRYIRNFSRRNKNSKWSDNTIGYGKQLIKDGRMMPIGLDFFKQGLSKPTHDHGIPKNPRMPRDLKEALDNNEKAKEIFEKHPNSKKKLIYRMILRAKLPETRKRRIEGVVKECLE